MEKNNIVPTTNTFSLALASVFFGRAIRNEFHLSQRQLGIRQDHIPQVRAHVFAEGSYKDAGGASGGASGEGSGDTRCFGTSMIHMY